MSPAQQLLVSPQPLIPQHLVFTMMMMMMMMMITIVMNMTFTTTTVMVVNMYQNNSNKPSPVHPCCIVITPEGEPTSATVVLSLNSNSSTNVTSHSMRSILACLTHLCKEPESPSGVLFTKLCEMSWVPTRSQSLILLLGMADHLGCLS